MRGRRVDSLREQDSFTERIVRPAQFSTEPIRSRSRGAAEAAGTGAGSAIGAGARAAPIRLSNSGEVRISVKVACTACWTAWAVASLTATATESLRASDRPSRIESNLSSWALNVLRVWPFVVGFMVILRVLLMTGEVARPDAQPRRERSDSDRLTVQGRPAGKGRLLLLPWRTCRVTGRGSGRREGGKRAGVSWRRAHRQGRAGRRSGRTGSGLSRPSPPERPPPGRSSDTPGSPRRRRRGQSPHADGTPAAAATTPAGAAPAAARTTTLAGGPGQTTGAGPAHARGPTKGRHPSGSRRSPRRPRHTDRRRSARRPRQTDRGTACGTGHPARPRRDGTTTRAD